MKKVNTSLLIALAAVGAAALTSCGPEVRGDVNLTFWSSFGQSYSNAVDVIVDMAETKISTDTFKVAIEHTPKKSYPNVKKEMMSAINDLSYPNMVTGYPDHFAEYAGKYILTPLDQLLEDYNKDHGVNLLEDYLPQYMEENYAIDCDRDTNEPVLSALPFNKSTEVLGYNGVFVDYCASLPAYAEDHLDEVPETWQDWAVKGVKYREILDSLAGVAKEGKKGLAVYGVQDYKGTASDFSVHARDEVKDADNNFIEAGNTGRKLLLDFTDVDRALSRVISWDSSDNMFITLVRQWGAEYTYLDKEQMKKDPLYRQGEIRFVSSANKQKVINCMRFFNEMNEKLIFGVPQEFQADYSSGKFEENSIMFMVCSSGGLSYNTAKWTNRFRVKPLPYNADLPNCKYVISQGADITLTDATNDYKEAFDAMVAMTTGDIQAEWCLKTGYYPCSKSATNSVKYQQFLHEADDDVIAARAQEIKNTSTTPKTDEEALAEARAEVYSPDKATRVAYREGSVVNEENYMNDAKNWHKFVDPAFKGSAIIRELIKAVFENTFITIAEASADDSVYGQILENIVSNTDITQKYKTNIKVVR